MPRRISSCLLLILTLAGCGTGEFRARMATGVSKLNAEAKSSALLPASAVPSPDNSPTGVSVQLPAIVSGSASINASTAGAQIPGVQVPGYFYSLQFKLTDASGKVTPGYCEYYVLPKGGIALADIKAQLLGALSAALPNATWEDKSFGQAPGAKLTAAADLEFELDGGVKETLPAQMELYLVESPSHFVALGWRATQSGAAAQKLFSQVQASMNTITVSAGQ
jgi:hypothetical protein